MSIRNTQNNRTAQIQQLLGTEGNAQGQGWPALNISADAVQDVPPHRIIQGQKLHYRKIRNCSGTFLGCVIAHRSQYSVWLPSEKQFTDTSHDRLV